MSRKFSDRRVLRSSRTRKSGTHKGRRRLACEPCEDRRMMATFTVTSALEQLTLTMSGEGSFNEAQIQAFVHEHPECLPVTEIDPVFVSPVSVCRELNTMAGPIDNLLITPSGLPIIVECKLWRNPEGRREVVGQILDYAKELSRWSSSDLQREVAKRTDLPGNPLLTLLKEAGHEVKYE